MPERQPPPQVTMGLLDYLSTHTYDEDYEAVAERRAGEGAAPPIGTEGGRPRSRRQAWARGSVVALVLVAFGVLLVTAGTQTSREAIALSDERKDLLAQINARTAALHHDQQRITQLQAGNRGLTRQAQADLATYRALAARNRHLAVLVGSTPVRGPGVAVVVDDAPDASRDERGKVLDSDLQRLVNGLWQAGAEAIAINGHRLTNLSAIRKAGGAITVNYFSLGPPYRVLAIGNPDTLPGRFAATSSGQAWFDLQQQVGLRFAIHPRESISLPEATTTLHYARPVHQGPEQQGGAP